MKSYNTEIFNEVVKSGDTTLRRYCEWLIDAPTFGARLFANLIEGWGTTENEHAQRDFPEVYAMIERHINEDPVLIELQSKLFAGLEGSAQKAGNQTWN